MEKQYLTNGWGEMLSLDADGKTHSVAEYVNFFALLISEKNAEWLKSVDAEEKKRLEKEISFQSRVLDSLCNASGAIKTNFCS